MKSQYHTVTVAHLRTDTCKSVYEVLSPPSLPFKFFAFFARTTGKCPRRIAEKPGCLWYCYHLKVAEYLRDEAKDYPKDVHLPGVTGRKL